MSRDEEHVQIELVLTNTSGKLAKIILEPWADEIDIAKGDEVTLTATGPAGSARISQEYDDDVLIVWAHRGWTIKASVNGKEVFTGSKGFPSI